MGKTIACPKCGHQMKIKDNPKPVDDPVVARPVASSAMPSKPAVAQLSILVLARPHRYSQTINRQLSTRSKRLDSVAYAAVVAGELRPS